MIRIGYALSSEEHAPNDLVANARRAEEAGFYFALISDHFHPWIDEQGHSPFVWTVIGGIAQVTERLRLGTGVTCPTMRIHPAIIAQAAATSAAMMPGRFFLGVGTGENLNEHIIGERWPPAGVRLEMLEEAIEIMRELWRGEETSNRGDYFTVDNARLYTLPDEPPAIVAAASSRGRRSSPAGSATASARRHRTRASWKSSAAAGGEGKPRYGRSSLLGGGRGRGPAHRPRVVAERRCSPGDQARSYRYLATSSRRRRPSPRTISRDMVCGPGPRRDIETIREYLDAGFDHVYVHQVGPDQEGFLAMYEREVLPALEAEHRHAA